MTVQANTTEVLYPGDDGAIADARKLFSEQRTAFNNSPVPTIRERKRDLKRLAGMIKSNEAALIAAVQQDFGCRSSHETRIAEILGSLATIKHLRKRLKKWAKPQRRHTSIWFMPGGNKVVSQPLGVVGVMSPWNFPIHLTIAPLASAIAAGNRVMVKMSELTPASSSLLKEMIAELFPSDKIAFIGGGVEAAKAFSAIPFDHLLFTGSTKVGRDVMRAAAENLTPVTLELGGKSPAIVDDGYSIAQAAKRILWGKLFNGGQICISPDYAIIPDGQIDAFIRHAQNQATTLYPQISGNPQYTSAIDEGNYRRLNDLLNDAEAKGARVDRLIPTGDQTLAAERKLPLTIISNVTDDMRITKEEIFGPILMLRTHSGIEDAIAQVNAGERPLALYLFSHRSGNVRKVLSQTTSGGVTINDTLLHYLQDDLPFGGVGHSGLGRYHGREGFDTFSHKKAVFKQRGMFGFTGAKLLYAPYGRIANFMIRIMSL